MMKAATISSLGLKLSLSLAIGLGLSTPASALYVEMFAIGDWGGGNCADSDANRGSWPGMAQAWYNKMGDKGHSKKGNWTNGSMDKRHFCDPQWNANCRDYDSASGYGVDWADAAIIAVHGSDAGDHWAGLMRWSAWDGDCWARGGSSGQMRLGDSWIEFIHLSSCFSANKDDLGNIRNAMQDTATSTSRRAHQWDGFHGIMWITSDFNGNYSETANDGHSVSVSDAWTMNHYKPGQFECESYDPFNWFGTCKDQCPVAYTIGTSGTDALNRLNNERYNYRPYGDPGGNGSYAYKYYPGCHPVGKAAW
jgi:hypothetical protein